jgi:sugar lactone lactonase YvrE
VPIAAPPAALHPVATAATCRAGGIPYPQAALTAGGGSLWVACRANGTILRLRRDGRVEATITLPGFRPWALAFAAGRVWAIDRDQPEVLAVGTSSGRIERHLRLPRSPVAVAAAGGAVWLGYDGRGATRVDPATGRTRELDAGDGVSGAAADGSSVWLVSHRDNILTRVAADGSSRTFAPLAPTETAAAEHVAFAGGSLWVTGRGLDLLRVDPRTGRVIRRTELGTAGIDVVPVAGRLLVPVYTAAGARRGDPLLAHVAAVDPGSGAIVATTTARGRVLYAGLAALGRAWVLADTVGGRLFRS